MRFSFEGVAGLHVLVDGFCEVGFVVFSVATGNVFLAGVGDDLVEC